MKKALILTILLLSNLFAIDFDQYFLNQTMRIDYYHVGDKSSDEIIFDLIYKEGEWAGNPKSLFDNFNNGKYYYKIYDINSNELIYTKGFNNFFHEYQTTAPAKEGIKRSYHESAIIPYPKNKILFVIEKRDRYNMLYPIYKKVIDPADYHIITENLKTDDLIVDANIVGKPHDCVDIVLVGEGYTEKDKKKFKKDVKRYTTELLDMEPFKRNKSKINVRGVLRYSAESGVDEPTKNIYRNSILDASFNTFDSPRYLLTENNKMLHDIVAQVPYDAIIILANLDRYGGGGIYNFYSISCANESDWNDYVFLHEFGHSFAGLADEYYSASVAYDEFYPEGVEPTEPNITRFLDGKNLKWEKLVSKGMAVPTDWNQDEFDGMNMKLGQLYKEKSAALSKLESEKASEEDIDGTEKKYDREINDLRKKVKGYTANNSLKGKVGLFEGGGYNAKGMYRPTMNSIMHQFTKEEKNFYPVNEAAIQAVIDYYTK